VKLNNMSIGEVIAINKTYSLKPTINLIVDGNGEKVSGNVVIDLENNLSCISLMLSVKTISPHNNLSLTWGPLLVHGATGFLSCQ